MAQAFRVKAGGSLLAGSVIIPPGTIIVAGEPIKFQGNVVPPISKAALDDMYMNGYVEQYGSKAEKVDANTLTDDVPGVSKALTVNGTGGKDNLGIDIDKALTTAGNDHTSSSSEGKGGITQQVVTVPKTEQQTSLWSIDPSTLEGKSLEDLNVMILERDKDQTPCGDIEEAKAFLSQDFKA